MLADDIDNHLWRLGPPGDRSQQKDKQVGDTSCFYSLHDQAASGKVYGSIHEFLALASDADFRIRALGTPDA